jgi:DNA polymerase III subunit gamma/tau
LLAVGEDVEPLLVEVEADPAPVAVPVAAEPAVPVAAEPAVPVAAEPAEPVAVPVAPAEPVAVLLLPPAAPLVELPTHGQSQSPANAKRPREMRANLFGGGEGRGYRNIGCRGERLFGDLRQCSW